MKPREFVGGNKVKKRKGELMIIEQFLKGLEEGLWHIW